MITSVRFYDLLNAMLSPSKCVYFNEIFIVVTDVAIRLLVTAESVMQRIAIH